MRRCSWSGKTVGELYRSQVVLSLASEVRSPRHTASLVLACGVGLWCWPVVLLSFDQILESLDVIDLDTAVVPGLQVGVAMTHAGNRDVAQCCSRCQEQNCVQRWSTSGAHLELGNRCSIVTHGACISISCTSRETKACFHSVGELDGVLAGDDPEE